MYHSFRELISFCIYSVSLLPSSVIAQAEAAQIIWFGASCFQVRKNSSKILFFGAFRRAGVIHNLIMGLIVAVIQMTKTSVDESLDMQFQSRRS